MDTEHEFEVWQNGGSVAWVNCGDRARDVEIIEGRCEPVLMGLAPGSVQAFVFSPPYNMSREYEKNTDQHSYVSWLSEIVVKCGAALAEGGSLWLQVGNLVRNGSTAPIDILIYPALARAGLVLRNRVIWVHDHGTHAKKRLSPRHEAILWATKGEPYLFDLDPIRVPQKWPGKKHFKGPKKGELSCNPLGKNPGDVWEITQVKNNHPEKTAHPCQFPEELVRRCVLATTAPGDLVVDPFAGSGTVGKVCRELGRRALLIERDARYVSIIRERIAVMTPPDRNASRVAGAGSRATKASSCGQIPSNSIPTDDQGGEGT